MNWLIVCDTAVMTNNLKMKGSLCDTYYVCSFAIFFNFVELNNLEMEMMQILKLNLAVNEMCQN